MTPSPRIGLVVDHPRRDLDGLVLVALELAEGGATVVLLPLYMAWMEAALADLDAVVLTYARKNNREQIRFLAEAGVDVYVLDTEGYLSSDKHTMLLDALRDLDVAPWLQGYFVWGEASGEAVAKADPRLADKILVTGCPRFDFLAPRWRGALDFPLRDYILINPNFNSVNPRHGLPDLERKSMITGGWDPAYIDGFLDDMRRAFEGFLELCQTLPKRLPHRQFVVRPHPFEMAEPYRQAIGSLPNVHLNAEGSVFEVLSHARRLVHLNCNTSVEARLLGLAPVQAGFLNSDLLRRHLPLYNGVSIIADSMEELCRLLDDDEALAARDRKDDVFEKWIRPSFAACDGFAARRVAEAILSRSRRGEGRRPKSYRSAEGAKSKARRALRFALCQTLGTAAVERIVYSQKRRQGKSFSQQRVQQLVERLSDHLSQPAPPVRRLRSRWTGVPMRESRSADALAAAPHRRISQGRYSQGRYSQGRYSQERISQGRISQAGPDAL